MSSKWVPWSRAAGSTHCSSVHIRKRHPFLQSQTHSLGIGAQADFQPTVPCVGHEHTWPNSGPLYPSSLLWAPECLLVLIHLCMSPAEKPVPIVTLCKRSYKLTWIECSLWAQAGLPHTRVIKCCDLQKALRAAEAEWIISSVLLSMDSGYFNICTWKLFRALRLKQMPTAFSYLVLCFWDLKNNSFPFP